MGVFPTNMSRTLHKVKYQSLRPQIPADMHRGLSELMTECWHENPAARPEIQEVAIRLERMKTDIEQPNYQNSDALLANTALLHKMLPPRVTESILKGRKVMIKASSSSLRSFVKISWRLLDMNGSGLS